MTHKGDMKTPEFGGRHSIAGLAYRTIQDRIGSAMIHDKLVAKALSIVDDDGNEVIRLGKQEDGNHAISLFNAAGVEIIRLGKQADDRYSMVTFDTSGTEKLRVGQLNDDTYGGEIVDSSGRVKLATLGFGWQAATVSTVEGTSSGTYTALATAGPAVTVTVGSSGRLLVWIACTQASSVSTQAAMSFALSGANTSASADAKSTFTNPSASSTIRQSVIEAISGLTAGSTTVTAQYRSDGATNNNFSERHMLAIPY